MPPTADLVGSVRQIELLFGDVVPGPHLEARLRARLRGERLPDGGGSGPWGWGLAFRRVHRPLALAFAAAMLVLLDERASRRDLGTTIAEGSSAEDPSDATPSHSLPPKARVDERAPLPVRRAPRDEERPEPPRTPPAVPSNVAPLVGPETVPSLEPMTPDGPSLFQVDEPIREDAPTFTPGGSRWGASANGLGSSRVAAPSNGPPPARDTRDRSASPPPPPRAAVDANAPCVAAEELFLEAQLRCKERGLGLDQAKYVEACGEGHYRGVVETCLDGSSGEPPGACKPVVVGDGSCLSLAELHDLAAASCGGEPSDLAPSLDCEGGASTMAKALCCEAMPPSPPPGTDHCSSMVVGDGATCVDPGALKTLASSACGPLVLADVSLAADCPGDLSTTAKVTCCQP